MHYMKKNNSQRKKDNYILCGEVEKKKTNIKPKIIVYKSKHSCAGI